MTGPGNESSFLEINEPVFVVMGLTPGTYYTFSVTAENAVSSQDTNINDRTTTITATTLEGGLCILYTFIIPISFPYAMSTYSCSSVCC